MNIDDSLYLDVDSNVGDEVGKVVNVGLDIDVDDEVRSSDNTWFELEVGDKVGSVNIRSVYEGFKGVKGEVSLGVGINVCWCVDGGVGARNDSADRITFEVDDGYDIGSNCILFDGYSVEKPLAHL